MYQFENTRKRCLDNPILPTSAMNYDGIFLEEAIQGYRTLYVEGREMLSVDLNAVAVQRGSKVISQSLPSRVLTVHYMIDNHDSYDIMTSYRELMYYLLRESEVPVYFRDELDATYYGRFSASEEVPGNRYSFVSSFTIFCSEPFKFSKLFVTDKEILRPILFNTTPDYIKVSGTKTGTLSVSNGSQKLTVSSVPNNGTVLFDFKENKVLVNGVNQTKRLGLTDPFERFYIKQGQSITADNGTIEIGYREVWL